MKRARDHHSIILVAMHVQCNAKVIGSISLARWLLITLVEYTSRRDKTQAAHGIRVIVGEVMVMIFITLLMIYLANADQLHNNNIKTRT